MKLNLRRIKMWIKNRIDSEYKKYGKQKDMDWSKMAELKILATIKYYIDNAPDIDRVGEHLKDKLGIK